MVNLAAVGEASDIPFPRVKSPSTPSYKGVSSLGHVPAWLHPSWGGFVNTIHSMARHRQSFGMNSKQGKVHVLEFTSPFVMSILVHTGSWV